MNCHFLVKCATGCLVWGRSIWASGKSLRWLSAGKHSNFSLALQKSRGGWKNLEQIFKLTDLEMFIPEHLFLHISLKEYIRSSRTYCFTLPIPEEGKKPKQKLPKSRTKPKHSPCFNFFQRSFPQTFTQKPQEMLERSLTSHRHAVACQCQPAGSRDWAIHVELPNTKCKLWSLNQLLQKDLPKAWAAGQAAIKLSSLWELLLQLLVFSFQKSIVPITSSSFTFSCDFCCSYTNVTTFTLMFGPFWQYSFISFVTLPWFWQK